MFVLHWTEYGTDAVTAEYTISHKAFVSGKIQDFQFYRTWYIVTTGL
jgi:hypothetical protein